MAWLGTAMQGEEYHRIGTPYPMVERNYTWHSMAGQGRARQGSATHGEEIVYYWNELGRGNGRRKKYPNINPGRNG